MALNCGRDKFKFGGSISVVGDYFIGESGDAVTEKLRQDSRLLQFSKHQVIRRSSRYTNYRTLGYKRKLEDTRKVFQHEHHIKVNENAKARTKITKIQQQYQQKLKESLSLPMLQETVPSLINNVPQTEVKLTENKKGRPNVKKVSTRGNELSILNPRHRSSQMPTKAVMKKLPSVNLHQKDSHLSARPITICTSDNSDRILNQAEKLTQHQKIKYEWKRNEGRRTAKMWNEFERIMLSVSECLQIEYKPSSWFKHQACIKKGQINITDKSSSLLRNNLFLRSYYFPYGNPDEIVFKL